MHLHSPVEPVNQGESDSNLSWRRRAWEEEYLGASSRSVVIRDSEVFLHQSASSPCLSAVRRAEGSWLEDCDGRKYLDFHGNSVHHIGHGHPRVIEAICRQLQTLTFAPRRFTCEKAVELAERLVKVAPEGLDRVLFAPSGSDAIEMAIAYARAATGRFKTISFWDSYHGAGFGARSIGGERMFRGEPIGPLLAGAEHVPPYGDYRNAWGVRGGSGDICANQIRYVLEKEGDICAVIAEPMRAAPCVPPEGFWRKVREACNEFGALLIFDEIPTGLGKTGRMFACEHEGVAPDILVLGKALGGGMLPIAAMMASSQLNVCANVSHGHYTHEKNPVSAAAALATLQVIDDEKLVESARRLGDLLCEKLRDLQNRHPLIGDVRGRGCLWGIELVVDRQTREPACTAAEAVLYAALKRGLSFKVMFGNVLTLGPPLNLSDEDLEIAIRVLDQSLEEAECELMV